MAKSAEADDILIQQARQGDLESFNQLVLRYQNLFFSRRLLILASEEAAGRSGAMQSERTSRQGAFPKLPTGPAILILGRLLFTATMASLRSKRG